MDEEHTQFLPTLLWKTNEFIGLPYSVGEVLLTGGKMATPENPYAAGIRASHSSTDGDSRPPPGCLQPIYSSSSPRPQPIKSESRTTDGR